MLRQEGNQHWWPGKTPFEVIVGAILTQNTSWLNVEKAISNLKKANVLSPEKLYRSSRRKLKEWVRPSGFFNIKAERLRNFLRYFKKRYNFSIGRMKKKNTEALRNELLSVNGIGKETADSILLYALKKTVFVIDAYTRRIFSRHGLIKHDIPYDDLKKIFENNLSPSEKLFNDYHAQIVRVGKNYCRKKPDCNKCPLQFLFEIPGLPSKIYP